MGTTLGETVEELSEQKALLPLQQNPLALLQQLLPLQQPIFQRSQKCFTIIAQGASHTVRLKVQRNDDQMKLLPCLRLRNLRAPDAKALKPLSRDQNGSATPGSSIHDTGMASGDSVKALSPSAARHESLKVKE